MVVAAALIMGTVFAAFILSADRIPKEFGLLLAVAILTDALIVRMTLVPAFLTLLGEKSWYIPRWLDRLLPNVTIEPPHDGDDRERLRARGAARAGGARLSRLRAAGRVSAPPPAASSTPLSAGISARGPAGQGDRQDVRRKARLEAARPGRQPPRDAA